METGWWIHFEAKDRAACTDIATSFIPTRSGQDLQASFSLLHEDGSPATPSRQKKRTPHGELHFQRSKLAVLFSASQDPNFLCSGRSKPNFLNVAPCRTIRKLDSSSSSFE